MADNFKQRESGLYAPEAGRGHIRSAEEAERARESVSAAEKIGSTEWKAKQWLETFTKFGGTRGRERIKAAEKALAAEKEKIKNAVISEKPMEPEKILEAVGVEPKTVEAQTVEAPKEVKKTEQEQDKRDGKISSLADVKKVGEERLKRLVAGLSYIVALDQFGVWGWQKGGEIAVKGGRYLAVLDFSPVTALEDVGRNISGRIQVGESLTRSMMAEGKIKAIDGIPAERRPDFYRGLLESLRRQSREASESLAGGYEKIHRKSEIARIIEKLRK